MDTSPVADMTASDAIDHIGRMTSTDKLLAINEHDTRKTVKDAAAARLAALDAAPAADKDQAKDEPLAPLQSGRNMTSEELADLEKSGWDRDYPLKQLTGKQAIDAISRIDNSDHLEVIIHEDKRQSVVDAAKARLRTTSTDRKRELAREKWGIYRVEVGGNKGEYKARDEKEAWAMFNDATKQSLSPKTPGRVITMIRPVPPEFPDVAPAAPATVHV
jgi:hypothetical protein